MQSSAAVRPKAAGSSRPVSHYRPEIQGLRAVAVLMVVVYHVWLGRVSGGVDVFLFISAFLLTSQFIRRHDDGARVNLLEHWLHVFKRLLPAAAVTLGGVLAAGAVFLADTRWNQLIDHTLASLFYVQNWVLAGESVDYFAQNKGTASPLLHFWSLSIQGQVFLLWPLILVVASSVSRRTRLSHRGLLWGVFGLVFAGSLAFSVWETGANQAYAYFDTRTRLWEFALGSLLALALPHLRLPRWFRVVLGWAGIIAMLACGIVLQVQQEFPGYLALWPTLSASAVIVAGSTGAPGSADRALSAPGIGWLGGISYALYLWHWPLLVIYLAQTGVERPDLVAGAGIIFLSIVLAWITTVLVESPIRRWKAADRGIVRPATAVLVCLALVAAPAIAWQSQLSSSAAQAEQVGGEQYPGAAALDGAPVPGNVRPRPELSALGSQWPLFANCTEDRATNEHQCDNGVAHGEKTIVMLGDSHPYMWSTPFLTMAKSRHWRVEATGRGACPLSDAAADPECAAWIAKHVDEVIAKHPDMVVTVSTRASYSAEATEYLDPGWERTIRRITAAGIRVAAIRDTPRWEDADLSGPECLARHRTDPVVCSIEESSVLAAQDPTEALQKTMPEVAFLDFNDYFCRGTTCPALIGNVVVYLDANHVTRAYMETLTPIVEQRFLAATGWS
ncbi:acyltransferase family protein [Sinomonas sp. B1-1]|uniref:acyltransferase family protein n=1 Tax=Sinomonas sp. B1-1 TaxID=3141454 RepID=UPI003D2683B5